MLFFPSSHALYPQASAWFISPLISHRIVQHASTGRHCVFWGTAGVRTHTGRAPSSSCARTNLAECIQTASSVTPSLTALGSPWLSPAAEPRESWAAGQPWAAGTAGRHRARLLTPGPAAPAAAGLKGGRCSGARHGPCAEGRVTPHTLDPPRFPSA